MSRFEFARKSGFLFLANNASSIIQYFFQMEMVRMLTDAQFAWMNTLFNMMSLLGAPIAAIQMDLCRRTSLGTGSKDIPRGIQIAGQTLGKILPWLALISFGIFFLRGPISLFFNASDEKAVGLAASGMTFSALGVICMGFFSGMQWFRFLGIMGLSMALARVILGYFLVRWGWGTSGGLLATYMVNLIPLVCFGFLAWRFQSKRPPPTPTHPDHGIFWMALLVIGINSVLTNLDLVMVKHYLPNEAPYFAVAGIFGRAMVFFLGPLGMTLVPLSSLQATQRNGDRDRLFWQCLKLCLILGAAAASLGGLLAHAALMIFKGQASMETTHLLQLYLWAMFPISLVTVAMNHVAALKSWKMTIQTAFLALLFPLAFIFWHGTLARVLAVDFTFGALILASLLLQIRSSSYSLQPAACRQET